MKHTALAIILILGLLLPCVVVHSRAADDTLPAWNKNFPKSQEILVPIDTSLTRAKGQPIDLPVAFHSPCWTKDPLATSIRIACWNGTGYSELPSQIYNLVANDSTHIRSCNVVFLVPPSANGLERYFLFYSPNQTQPTTYPDHLQIVDQTYQFSPIKEISAQAQFYGIIEDNYDVFGIGQEGKILDRACAQVVVKQPKHTTHFDALNADQFVSFAFSYYYGSDEKDESSSDQVFIDKKILVDGTLMVSVLITSQSNLGDIRTTNEYRYYYTPGDDKHLYVHASHQMLKAATVTGMDNIDGRFGSIISVQARSSTIDSLNMGIISPLLDFNSTTLPIEEYQMDQNPETTDREWIIPYQDNADLGPQAWISYGNGPVGRANAVIFAGNTGLIKTGSGEQDGISLKVCEKQYFNFLGTQVDYASLNFGRNSYDPATGHDTSIPANLLVQFDAETFYSETGGYLATQQEASLFQALIHRHIQPPTPPQNATHFNLTVNASFGGTFLAFPWLGQHTGSSFPAVTMDLFRNGTYLSTQQANRSLLTNATARFTNITTGRYLIRVSLNVANSRYVIGASILTLNRTTTTQIICTWERAVKITVLNQNNRGIPQVTIRLQNKDGVVFDHNITDATGILTLRAPYNANDSYTVAALYKERPIYTASLPVTIQYATASITLPLYNLSIKVVDALNLLPAVNITPLLSITTGNQTTDITPDSTDGTYYHFTNLLADNYTAEVPYRSHLDSLPVRIPRDGPAIQLQFTQTYPVSLDIYDQRGNPIGTSSILLKVLRDDTQVYSSLKHTFFLPPAHYQILLYDQEKLVATKTIDLTNEHHTAIVTSLDPPLPPYIIAVSVTIFLLVALLTVLRKTRLRTLCLAATFCLALLAIITPWWELTGTSTTPSISRHIAMYIQPGTLVETITNQTATQRTISEMPAQFTTFLNLVIIALTLTCILAAITAVISLSKKLRVSMVAQVILIILLAGTTILYVYGTSILTEIGIGSLQGSGPLPVIINDVDYTITSTWGLSSGYYLIILSILTAAAGFVLTLLDWRKTKQSSNTQS